MNTSKLKTNNLKVIGHQGIHDLERGNNIFGFIAAGNRSSYWGIETDVQRTKDGRYLCNHDTNIVDSNGVSHNISESTFDELRSFTLTDKDGCTDRADLRLTSLEEYIKICKRYKKIAVLELKSPMIPEHVLEVIDTIRSMDYLDGTSFISFHRQNIEAVRKFLPNQHAQFLTVAYNEEIREFLLKNNFGLDIAWTVMTDNVIKDAVSHGIPVNSWNVDDLSLSKHYDEMGVSYITSNVIEKDISEDAWVDFEVPYFDVSKRTVLSQTIKFKNQNIKTIAHQGYIGLEKENTNCAFVAAANHDNVFGIETDVHRTKDGRYVISHDSNVYYVDGTVLNIEESSFDDLRAKPIPDIDRSVERTDVRISSLEEYIKICHKYDKVSILELKTELKPEEVREVADIVKNLGHLDKTVFISFYRQNLIALREYMPNQAAQYLTVDYNDEIRDFMVDNHFDLDIRWMECTDEVIKDAKAHGLKINIWSLDDIGLAESFDKKGVDFITTNILEGFYKMK